MNCRSCVISPPVKIPLRIVRQGDRVGDEWNIRADREGTTRNCTDATESDPCEHVNIRILADDHITF